MLTRVRRSPEHEASRVQAAHPPAATQLWEAARADYVRGLCVLPPTAPDRLRVLVGDWAGETMVADVPLRAQ